jgi:hypothetical protein
MGDSDKLSKEGKIIPSRVWYYLLDWNDRDSFKTLNELYGVKRLGELTSNQIANLLYVASQSDIRKINNEK